VPVEWHKALSSRDYAAWRDEIVRHMHTTLALRTEVFGAKLALRDGNVDPELATAAAAAHAAVAEAHNRLAQLDYLLGERAQSATAMEGNE